MDRETQIKILMKDRCTKSEAEKYLENRVTIYEDLEENLEQYLEEWTHLNDESDDVKYTDQVREMIETKIPMTDWGVVEYEGHTYYIEYVN